jgi:DNA-directed RNA polymerase specialized sigma24 family protein
MTAAEPGGVAGRSSGVRRPAAAQATAGSRSVERDADAAVAALYAEHYRSLVALAVLLVTDAGAAEVVVQDSFVALHRGWRLLGRDGPGGDQALCYLRQCVVSRSRAARRHSVPRGTDAVALGRALAQGPAPGQQRSAALAALHALPPRQREVLALQHYAGLSASQTARMLGTSTSAVQRRTAQAMASLRGVLEPRAGGSVP